MKRSAADQQHPDDNFRKGFSHKLKHYQAAPHRDLWNRIELTLDKQEAGIYKKRFKIYSQLAAACLLLLLSAGGFLAYKQWRQPVQNASLADLKTAPANQEPAIAFSQPNVQETGQAQVPAPVISDAVTNSPEIAGGTAQVPGSGLAFRQGSEGTGKAENAMENRLKNAPEPKAETRKALAGTRTVSRPEETGFSESAPSLAIITARRPTETIAATQKPAANFSGRNPGVTETGKLQSGIALQQPLEDQAANGRENAAKTTAPAHLAAGKPETTEQPASTSQEIVANKAIALGAPENEAAASRSVENQPEQTILAAAKIAPDSAISLPALAASVAVSPDTLTVETAILKPEKQLSKWSVGASYAATYFKQNLALDAAAFLPQRNALGTAQPTQLSALAPAIAEFNQETGSAYSWQAGLEITYALNRRWQLLSGLRFAANRAVTKTSWVIAQNQYAPVSQDASAGQPVLPAVLSQAAFDQDALLVSTPETKTYYSYQYLGLPLQLQFSNRFGETLGSYVAVGGMVNRLVYNNLVDSGRQEVSAASGMQVKTSNGNKLRNWQLAGTLAAGLSYRVTPQWQLQAGAETVWFAQSLFHNDQQNAMVNTNPFTVGGKAGLSYTFAK